MIASCGYPHARPVLLRPPPCSYIDIEQEIHESSRTHTPSNKFGSWPYFSICSCIQSSDGFVNSSTIFPSSTSIASTTCPFIPTLSPSAKDSVLSSTLQITGEVIFFDINCHCGFLLLSVLRLCRLLCTIPSSPVFIQHRFSSRPFFPAVCTISS